MRYITNMSDDPTLSRRRRARLVHWCVPLLGWLIFVVWYTDFRGPMTDQEVNATLGHLRERGIDGERLQNFERFLREDTGRQFLMVNNIDTNDQPPQMPGFGEDATAADYSAHYMEHMYRQLLARACHPIFFGRGLGVGIDIAGIDNAYGWDVAALFRYRSRRAFAQIVTHPDTGARHAFKLASMTKTIAYPVEAGLYVSDLRLVLFLVLGLFTAIGDILRFGRGH